MEGIYNPEQYEHGSMNWLAACVLEDGTLERRQKPGMPMPYYFFYPMHPAMRALLASWKKEKGIHPGDALSDMQRTVWEIECLSDEAREALTEHYARRKNYGEAVRAALKGGEDDLIEILERLNK